MRFTPAAERLLSEMAAIRPEREGYWHDLAIQLAQSQKAERVKRAHMEAAIMAASPEFVEAGE